ncbi:transmembrane protein 252 [Rana temporaria]|uniref:transmembrane protein 252 n=1 Tax=Rana temporaria TaxID=8407 RepID=UPI001AAC7AD6|nr:transmembrane protein 252 [Rana temporaria]
MKTNVYTILRFLLLVLGFCLVCLGAFFVSSSYSCNCRHETVVAYTLMPLGFLLLLIGIFWSTYHEANHKSLFQNMIRRIHSQQEVHIETVDRPDFYPPSYETALHHTVLHPNASCHIYVGEQGFNIPPPLYTETTMDVVDETFLCEDSPPSYEMSVQTRAPDAEVNTERVPETENITSLETND